MFSFVPLLNEVLLIVNNGLLDTFDGQSLHFRTKLLLLFLVFVQAMLIIKQVLADKASPVQVLE